MNKKRKILAVILLQLFLCVITNAQSSVWISYYERGLEADQIGKLSEAEKYLNLAIEEAETAVKDGEKDANVMLQKTLTSLANVYWKQNKFIEAEKVARKSLELAEKIYQENNPEYSKPLNNLGLILTDQKKFVEAEEIHRKAMKNREKYDVPPYRNLIVSMLSLGKVYFDQGKYLKADALFNTTLEYITAIPEDLIEPGDSGLTLMALTNSAMTYEKLNNLDKAKSTYETLIDVIEIVLGKNHPSIIPHLKKYAVILRAKKMNAEAARVDRKIKSLEQKNN